jgi:hypothetical protein
MKNINAPGLLGEGARAGDGWGLSWGWGVSAHAQGVVSTRLHSVQHVVIVGVLNIVL